MKFLGFPVIIIDYAFIKYCKSIIYKVDFPENEKEEQNIIFYISIQKNKIV